jgi:hypothetical protein
MMRAGPVQADGKRSAVAGAWAVPWPGGGRYGAGSLDGLVCLRGRKGGSDRRAAGMGDVYSTDCLSSLGFVGWLFVWWLIV